MGYANVKNHNGGGANNANGQRERVRRSSRGFAAMDPEQRRLISSVGGKAAHQKGRAHEFTPQEAREAGRKGGRRAPSRGRA